MGWASGGDLAEEVWRVVAPHLPESRVLDVAEGLVRAFEDHDCDVLSEVAGPIGDAAHRMSFARWYKAPLHPLKGDRVLADGASWVFDGQRWVYDE